jgi:hypothetical protein
MDVWFALGLPECAIDLSLLSGIYPRGWTFQYAYEVGEDAQSSRQAIPQAGLRAIPHNLAGLPPAFPTDPDGEYLRVTLMPMRL